MEAIPKEELDKMIYDSRYTFFINKEKNQGNEYQALKIQQVKKGKVRYWVIWIRAQSGQYKNDQGLFFAVSLGDSLLNSDFLKAIKVGSWFKFVNVRQRGLAYKFVITR